MILLAAIAAFRDDDDTVCANTAINWEVALTVAESSSSHLCVSQSRWASL
jgi:hypothetical protein